MQPQPQRSGRRAPGLTGNATCGQASAGTSAGDDNRVLAVLFGKASASNGGTATSNVSGAAINSGDNTDNQVQIGS